MPWDGNERRQSPYCNCGVMLPEMKESIDDIHQILTGNGKPQEGLVFKVAKNTDHRHFMSKWGWLVVSLITAAPFTVFIWIVVGMLRNGPFK